MTCRCAVRGLAAACRAFPERRARRESPRRHASILLAPRLEAHLPRIALRALRQLSREPYDDCPRNVAVSSVSLHVRERLVLPGTFECELGRLFEPFGPEIRGHPVRPAPDLACVAGVDRKRNEAQAGEADPDVVDVEIELAGDLMGDELSSSPI